MVGSDTNPFFRRGPIRQRGYFCGRTDHVGQSLSLLRNGQNVSLIGQRRTGKTSLLFHIADPVVFEAHGLHRLLLQIAAFHAIELWVQEGWPAEEAASLRGEWHRHFMAEAESHFEYYWRHLTDGDRYALATLPLSQQDEAQREAIRRLEQACLIRRYEQGYAYLSPAFEEFVRRQSAWSPDGG